MMANISAYIIMQYMHGHVVVYASDNHTQGLHFQENSCEPSNVAFKTRLAGLNKLSDHKDTVKYIPPVKP